MLPYQVTCYFMHLFQQVFIRLSFHSSVWIFPFLYLVQCILHDCWEISDVKFLYIHLSRACWPTSTLSQLILLFKFPVLSTYLSPGVSRERKKVLKRKVRNCTYIISKINLKYYINKIIIFINIIILKKEHLGIQQVTYKVLFCRAILKVLYCWKQEYNYLTFSKMTLLMLYARCLHSANDRSTSDHSGGTSDSNNQMSQLYYSVRSMNFCFSVI